MISVAVTGGIGSGKSVVCKIFEQLGIPVFYADEEAKDLYNKDQEIKNKLVEKFGKEIFSNNILNKNKLANIVYNDSDALLSINAIVHPKVLELYNNWKKNKNTQYVIQESAIIFENSLEKNFDKIIAVSAPKEIRINRVISRKGYSKEKIERIMKTQLTNDYIEKHSDFVVVNDGNSLVLPVVLDIHNKLSAR